MMNLIKSYTRWLHTGWPAGTVEKLPLVREDGSTNVPGVYIVGDLTGIPLLKFSADTGARAVETIVNDPAFQKSRQDSADPKALDLVIVGGGVSGLAAALMARNHQLNFKIIEAAQKFSTVVNFPKAKPIYTYPKEMTPAGDLQFRAEVKEPLLEEMEAQTKGIELTFAHVDHIRPKGGLLEVAITDQPPLRARRVIIAIGRSGNFRKLNISGEELDKVSNRLHDPKDFADKNVMVVGGGDSALETAIALAQCGARVTIVYRKPEFARPKPDNIEKLQMLEADPLADVAIEMPTSERVTTSAGMFMGAHRKAGSITRLMPANPLRIEADAVVVQDRDKKEVRVPNDYVYTMIGREAPLDFFRRSGIRIKGERTAVWWASLSAFLLFCFWMYHWKKPGVTITGIDRIDPYLNVGKWWGENGWFPYGFAAWLKSLGGVWTDPHYLLGTLRVSMGEPGFWYSLAYCVCVVGFGIDRIKRRRTPYVTRQTTVLTLMQVVPLFLLPYLLLPWLGQNGWFDTGVGRWFADTFFPTNTWSEHGRDYWRAFGFILAWPLFIWNVFNSQPLWGWLIVSLIQTFVIIPGMIYFWGKGAYCGWVCSCGALAETLGDRHREKMPHGPLWNRLNLIGQAFLLFAFVLLLLRVVGWMYPGGKVEHAFEYLLHDLPLLNYVWFVDLFWAGILGVGLYFWFSGRVWCRFACPLAALMHIYARFSRFRILADKKKCISCNVCTSVCHQGIDIMNFANKGLPMADPECVRCSACVQSCPTGVLSFGQLNPKTGATIRKDRLPASWIQIQEH